MTSTGPRAAILLSTYNGQKFLPELLESLLQQTYSDFHLIVRDDGSTDDSPAMTMAYRERFVQMTFLSDNEHVGPIDSFSRVAQEALRFPEIDFFFFCDQDDIWEKEKLKIYMETTLLPETDPAKLRLVFSDLTAVDVDLKLIHLSHMAFNRMRPENTSLNRLLMQNVPVGCTAMVNRSLLHAALPFPSDALMHDEWINLCAAALGEFVFIDRPLVRYRRHLESVTGLAGFTWRYMISQCIRRPDLSARIYQAEVLLSRYQQELPEEKLMLLRQFISLKDIGLWGRLQKIIAFQFFKTPLLRTIGIFFARFDGPRQVRFFPSRANQKIKKPYNP